MSKFFWLLVHYQIPPTNVDNVLTLDRVVLVAAMVGGFEINYARVLILVIHERAFKTSSTYPFACLIFQLCREVGVPIWHCDTLCHPAGIVDIYLIKDESNVAGPRRGPRIEVTPLSKNLVETVELA